MTAITAAASEPIGLEKDRLLYLDGWRGWAVSLVLLGHFAPVPGINLGTLGVELFFVLSGRLMAEILFIKKMPLRTFFPRRINRVYPALFVFVVAIAIVSQFFSWQIGAKPIAAALTFTTNYAPVIPGMYRHGFTDHLWSLSVEEHSYVVLAGVVIAGRLWKLKPLPIILAVTAVGFAGGILSMNVFGLDYFQTYWRTDVHIASIFVAAGVHMWINERRLTLPAWVAPVCLALGFVFSMRIFPATVTYTVGTTLFAISVCSLGSTWRWARAAFDNPVLIMVGVYSYSIYLWQQPFYKLHELGQVAPWVGLLLSIGIGWLSYKLIENPSRSFLNGLAARRIYIAPDVKSSKV